MIDGDSNQGTAPGTVSDSSGPSVYPIGRSSDHTVPGSSLRNSVTTPWDEILAGVTSTFRVHLDKELSMKAAGKTYMQECDSPKRRIQLGKMRESRRPESWCIFAFEVHEVRIRRS
jgi:hypothetical protein